MEKYFTVLNKNLTEMPDEKGNNKSEAPLV